MRSDAPGVAIAQVTQDVFDSLGGGVLLIPAGARLVGDYDAQNRRAEIRLACQLPITAVFDGLVARLPEQQR